MNYHKIIKSFFSKRNSLPLYLILFVTNRCNAQCPHCFYWKNLNQPAEELTLEELIKISRNVKGVQHLAITGGEPILRLDLAAIIGAFYKNGGIHSISWQTNGFLTEKIISTAKKVLTECPKLKLQIAVSLDEIAGRHDSFRVLPDLFNKTKETIAGLKSLHQNNLSVAVNLTLSARNQRRIRSIYSYIRDTIKPDAIFPLLVRGEPRNKKLPSIQPAFYRQLINLSRQDIAKNRSISQRFSFYSWLSARDAIARKLSMANLSGKKIPRPKCVAGRLTGIIYENGLVSACEIKNLEMSNIRKADYDLKKIWSSPEAIRARNWIKKNKCFCTHECFFNFNVLFSWRLLPRLIKEQLKILWSTSR